MKPKAIHESVPLSMVAQRVKYTETRNVLRFTVFQPRNVDILHYKHLKSEVQNLKQQYLENRKSELIGFCQADTEI